MLRRYILFSSRFNTSIQYQSFPTSLHQAYSYFVSLKYANSRVCYLSTSLSTFSTKTRNDLVSNCSAPTVDQARCCHVAGPLAKQPDTVWKYQRSDPLPQSIPELEPFHTDILNATHNYDVKEAEKVYRQLQNENVKPDDLTLELMLRAHLSGIYSWNTGRRRTLPWQSLRRMEKLFRQHRHRHKPRPPTQLAYNLLLQAYGSVYPADRQNAWTMYQQMLKDDVAPGKRTFGNLITVYMRRDDIEGAEKVVKEMRRLNRQPNGVIYAALIHTYVKAQRITDALAIYYQMRVEGVQVNAYIYTELIHAHVNSSDMAEAERTFARMLVNDVRPTVVTLCELMRGYARFGNAVAARNKFDEFDRRGLVPSTMAYNILLHIYSEKRDATAFNEILQRMNSKHVHRDIVTFNTLIHWSILMDDIPAAYRYYRELLAAGIQPDDITKNIMSKVKSNLSITTENSS
ncbi:hypothetical protein BDF19DRAFT_447531 [Syncephalis fuscata]|nr:hypothetical protein BDF19DRAFT_447531 [Syncephalis fuscata]